MGKKPFRFRESKGMFAGLVFETPNLVPRSLQHRSRYDPHSGQREAARRLKRMQHEKTDSGTPDTGSN